MMVNKVSIVIPIYNDERYIRETLNSVQSQSYTNWTCILVNDGSTDSTQNIIEDYTKADKRFVSFVIPNSGAADYPIGYGMEKVTSPFCLVLGHDDVLAPDFLEIQLQRQKETNADIVSPTMVFCEKELEGEIWRLPCEPIKSTDLITGERAVAYTIGGWKLAANGMLYRAEFNKGIVRGRYMNSDEFSGRQILYKADIVAFSEAKYIYRQHSESISRKMSPRLWERLIVDKQIENFIFKHYSNNEEIKRTIVSSVFFKQVALTAAAWLEAKNFDKDSLRIVRKGVLEAYTNMNKDRVKTYLPQHSKLFLHGVNIFILMSILYTLIRRIQGKKEEL